MISNTPVILFAYARPEHLRRTLACLRRDNVPLIWAFSDAPRTPDKASAVNQVRKMLRTVDWCELVLCERESNLGLGRSILAGVAEVFQRYESAIVFEDDLITVPGTYQYLCAALANYRDDPRVMSVTGWTHPKVTPENISDRPYFDGRTDCWVWGTWARAWQGMTRDAKTLMRICAERKIDVFRYGADLPAMAEVELAKNIWAVRFSYLHIVNGGLCLRPPHSLVEHIGFDSLATNAFDDSLWGNPPLKFCPPLPDQWPIPVENPECPVLWQKACGAQSSWAQRSSRRIWRLLTEVTRTVRIFR